MSETIVVRWSRPINPVYDQLYARIARPLLQEDGLVILDVADLVMVSFEGDEIWRCRHDYGFLGSPVQWRAGVLACATLDNAIEAVGRNGQTIQTIELPASASTPLLAQDGKLWLGVGSGECSVIMLDSRGAVVYEQFLSSNEGINHPLALSEGTLWVPTNDGLFGLHSDTGAVSTHITDIACISNPLIGDNRVTVAATNRDGAQLLMQIDHSGSVLQQHNLPPLYRARLLPRAGGFWLVGSSVSPWDELSSSNALVIAQLGATGVIERSTTLAPQRAIDASVDSRNRLWIGGFTRSDEGDTGVLLGYTEDFEQLLTWTPQPAAGVSAPTYVSHPSHGLVIATSSHVIWVQDVEH